MAHINHVGRIKFKSNNFIPDNTDKKKIGDYLIEQIPAERNSEGIVNFTLTENTEDMNKDTLFRQTELEAS